MATAPQMAPQMPGQMAQPGQDGEMSPDTDPAGSVELCIQVAKDGSMTVYKEVAGQAGGEMGEQETQRQPAADIGEALKLVLQLYKGLDQQGADASFDQGFGTKPPQSQGQGGMRGGM